MADSITVHTPVLGLSQRLDDASGITRPPPIGLTFPVPQAILDPLAATDSGEEKIEVEGELDNLTPLPEPTPPYRSAPQVQKPAPQL